MHLGSLYTATASFLDARAHGGRWLVRMEDIDTPRVVAGAAKRILHTLNAFGFEWDGPAVRQSDRLECYEQALGALQSRALTFECSCSRARLQEERYPGTCRAGPSLQATPTATRLRVDEEFVHFTDRIQGRFRQNVGAAVGDFALRRRDGLFGYVLAVVVDDAAQGVTHIVRGADLLDNTPRQIHLQRLLRLPQPDYAHVPVLTEPDGRKLAKSARSLPLDARGALEQLLRIFELQGLDPPHELTAAALPEAWAWAIARWNINTVPKRLTLKLDH